MPIRARLTAAARGAAQEASRRIARDNRSAARAFRAALDKTTLLIAEHPEVGFVRPELASAPYRFFVVNGFPYIVVYDPTTRPPTIVRVVHGARDLPEVLRDLQ
jgi:toxin ParE1/3/4